MGRDGFEPPVFQVSRIYSPLPSTNSAHLPEKDIVTALPVLFALYSFCVNASGHECGFVAVIASPVARHNIITYHSSFGSATNWVCPEGQDCQRSFGDGSYPSPSDCVFTISQDNRQEKGEKNLPERGNFGLV